MTKKIILAFASMMLAASSALAYGTITYTAAANYPSNTHVQAEYYVYYDAGTSFVVTVSGVGGGGGVAYAIANTQIMAIANSGGGPGTPFYATNSCTLGYAQGVNIRVDATASSSGAYTTSTVVANW